MNISKHQHQDYLISVDPATSSWSPFDKFTVCIFAVLSALIVSMTTLLASALSITEELTVSLVTGELVAVT